MPPMNLERSTAFTEAVQSRGLAIEHAVARIFDGGEIDLVMGALRRPMWRCRRSSTPSRGCEWNGQHDLPRFVSDLERPSESLVQGCPTSETSGYPAFAGPQSFPLDGIKVG